MGSKSRARTVYKERCGECGAKYQDRSPLGLFAKRRAHQAWHDEQDQLAPVPEPTPGDQSGPPWIDEIHALAEADLDVVVGRKS